MSFFLQKQVSQLNKIFTDVYSNKKEKHLNGIGLRLPRQIGVSCVKECIKKIEERQVWYVKNIFFFYLCNRSYCLQVVEVEHT